MHRVAEVGMAAHWAYQSYKRGVGSADFDTPWLSSIKEWQQDHINSRDFVESVRREVSIGENWSSGILGFHPLGFLCSPRYTWF